jgi:hypothetical protein
VLNGGRDKLTAEELAFLGVYPPRPRDGWHQPGEYLILSPLKLDEDAPIAEGRLVLLQHMLAKEWAPRQPFSAERPFRTRR